MKKILYLHGLESNGLSQEKREIIEKFGVVDAPIFHYKTDKDILESTIKMVDSNDYDIIIGSSMGGRLGYYVSCFTQTPVLLFNPAIISKIGDTHLPISIANELNGHVGFHSNIKFIWGKNDDVIDNKKLEESLLSTLSHKIKPGWSKWVDMGHRVDSKILDKELSNFIQQLYTTRVKFL